MSDNSIPISNFVHPHRAAYLLGAENNGIPQKVLTRCHHVVRLPDEISMNVAICGGIVLYDRLSKTELK
jgi:tRNA G18 (ribose-2'-O)-methylase SpoU